LLRRLVTRTRVKADEVVSHLPSSLVLFWRRFNSAVAKRVATNPASRNGFNAVEFPEMVLRDSWYFRPTNYWRRIADTTCTNQRVQGWADCVILYQEFGLLV
jgi:hypothetical protein